MYRMIVVDDNKLERKGISRMADWEKEGIEIVGQYMHGQQALDQLESDRPHLVLADIQMPVMNGLELASEIKALQPDTRVLFMSSYDDFAFVKSAVQLGADDYILKPLGAEEVLAAIRKAIARIETAGRLTEERRRMTEQLNRSLSLYQEQFMRDLLFGLAPDGEETSLKLQMLSMAAEESARYQVCSLRFAFDGEWLRAGRVDDKFFASYMVKKLAKECHEWMSRYPAVQITDQEFVIVLAAPGTAEKGTLLDAVVGLQELVREQLRLPCRIGISRVAGRLAELPVLYRQSTAALRTKFYGEGDLIISYEEIEERGAFELEFDFQSLHRDIKEILLSDSPTGFDAMEGIWKHLEGGAVQLSEERIKAFLITFNNAMQLAHLEVQQSVRALTLDTFKDLEWSEDADLARLKAKIHSILEAARELVHKQHKPQYDQIVDKIDHMIAGHYHEELTVNRIAESVYMSPSHANSIYKSKTGHTIFDALVEYRMEKAKTLLRDPASRIYLTALQVGYTNKSHFCHVFKKIVGVTPSEFKNGIHPEKGG